MKKNKMTFEEESSRLAVGLKQARLQFMQDWKQMNADKYKNQRL
jgi:hypothetical protein